jgi:uncharacterized protein YegL
MSDQNQGSTPDPNAAAQPATTGFNLNNVEVVIAIDTSGTMKEQDVRPNSPLTRLEAVHESASALAAELEKYDDDGITVVRFAGKVRIYDGVTHAKVDQVFAEFRPMGSTATDEALRQIIDKFMDKRQQKGDVKPCCIIVFTDGEPDNPIGVAQVIVDATKKIKSRDELGILFIQVGNDPGATAYLEKLNNHLTDAGAAFDIVAVTQLDKLEDLAPAEIIEMAFTD